MSVLSPSVTEPGAAESPRSTLDLLHDWVVTVDHKRLGIMYVAVGLLFFVIAGLEATMMRIQLAWPGLHIVPPETFNRLFTMHGTTMVFLVGIPIVFGFGNYLVPLMIGARDLAFPRLNAFGVLDPPLRRAPPPLQRGRGRRSLRRGLGSRRRMVRVQIGRAHV